MYLSVFYEVMGMRLLDKGEAILSVRCSEHKDIGTPVLLSGLQLAKTSSSNSETVWIQF